MSSSKEELKIKRITTESLDEAIKLLAGAFEHDPLIRYIFDPHGKAFNRHLHLLFGFSCEMRLSMGWPVLGAFLGARLAGVACISPPVPPNVQVWTEEVVALSDAFMTQIGNEAAERRREYVRLVEEHRPTSPHFYLATLGVQPDLQGRGFGHVLLDAVQFLSKSHQSSSGVALDAETMKNVALYQRIGYQVTATALLDGVFLRFMFQPNVDNASPMREAH